MRLRHAKSFTMNFQLLKSFDNKLIWCDVSTGHIRTYITAKISKKIGFLDFTRIRSSIA